MVRMTIILAAALAGIAAAAAARSPAASVPAASVESIPLDLSGPRPLATLTTVLDPAERRGWLLR